MIEFDIPDEVRLRFVQTPPSLDNPFPAGLVVEAWSPGGDFVRAFGIREMGAWLNKHGFSYVFGSNARWVRPMPAWRAWPLGFLPPT